MSLDSLSHLLCADMAMHSFNPVFATLVATTYVINVHNFSCHSVHEPLSVWAGVGTIQHILSNLALCLLKLVECLIMLQASV